MRRRGRELRDYTAPADLFNLVFFVVAFGVALATFVLVDRDFAIVSGFVANLVTFRPRRSSCGRAPRRCCRLSRWSCSRC